MGWGSTNKSRGAFICYISVSIGKKYLPRKSCVIGIVLKNEGLGAFPQIFFVATPSITSENALFVK